MRKARLVGSFSIYFLIFGESRVLVLYKDLFFGGDREFEYLRSGLIFGKEHSSLISSITFSVLLLMPPNIF